MATGLETTFATLVASHNNATNPVLLAALESTNTAVHDGAFKAIIARRNKAGHLAILQRWHLLSLEQKEYLQEGRGRMSGALRDAVLSEDDQLFVNACELVEQFKEFDLISTLVTLAENQKNKHAEAATAFVLRLVEQLSERVHGPRDYQDRRDPQLLCRFVLDSLEQSLKRFRTHKRSELIEAFVILGGPSSALLQQILGEPHHPCYLTVIHTLTSSQSTGVIELLLNSLKSEFALLSILHVISKREDPKFVTLLLDFAGEKFPPKMVKNLKRIRSFVWLQPGERGFDSFDEQHQSRCIKLVAASGVNQEEFLDLLESILKRGEPAARYAACEALASIPGDRGNHLVLGAIDDRDANVQAVATRQIRDRHIPGAMAILLKQIDSPFEVVREATCEALSEFSFANYLAGFEGLHDDARCTTGALVKKVDSQTVSSILSEMEEPSRKRRLRAVEMSEVMELVPELVEGLLVLLDDEDHMIRAATADALQFCPTAEVQNALREAANDPSSSVQNAAKSSLAIFDELAAPGSAGVTATVEGQR